MTDTLLFKGSGRFRTDADHLPEMRIFATLAAAEEYALTHPKAAPGQILTVTGATSTKAYLIQWNKTLREVCNGDGTGFSPYVENITGDGSTTSFLVTHGLGHINFEVSFRDISATPMRPVYLAWEIVDDNSIRILPDVILPSTKTIRVIIK